MRTPAPSVTALAYPLPAPAAVCRSPTPPTLRRTSGQTRRCCGGLAVPCRSVQRGWWYEGRSSTVLSPLFIFVRTKPTFTYVQFIRLDSYAPSQISTLESLFIWTKQFAKLPSTWGALPGMLQPVVRFAGAHQKGVPVGPTPPSSRRLLHPKVWPRRTCGAGEG